MIQCSLYDAKPYDREYFRRAAGRERVEWKFLDFRLTTETSVTATGCEAVCVFVNDKVNRECIAKLAGIGVKVIALRCAGFNNVDLAAAKEFGLTVVRVPAYSPHAVAEHAVGLLLTLNRRIHRAFNRVREHNFSLAGLVGFDLYGKVIGVVGTGKIGRIAAQIFKGFGCEVIAYDPFPEATWAAQAGVIYAEFQDLLAKSDVITLHLPLTSESMHLFSAGNFSQMKPGATLINTSRGKLVDTTALIESLKSGRLGGVALDVYEEEEGVFFEDHSDHVLQDDELNLLLTFPNVLITSHQAFLTKEALSEIARVTTTNILHLHDGLEPLNSTRL